MMRTIYVLSVLAASLAPASGITADTVPSLPVSSSGHAESGTRTATVGSVRVFDGKLGRERLASAVEAARIIEAYWTPERQDAAIPVLARAAARVAAKAGPRSDGTPQKRVDPVLPEQREPEARATVSFSNAEGKIFFRDPKDGKDYQCSGGTVGSGKRRLVFTAAHCVHGGPGGQWMINWAFQPGYQRGTGWPGVFPYYQLWAQSSWTSSGDNHFDYGIAITWNNAAGGRVVDLVGGNGLITNPGRPFVTAIGYPFNFLEGETQSHCQVTLFRRSVLNSDQALNCWRGPGASGEPWLKDYDNSSRLGFIVGDSSYRTYDDAPVYGPYLDDDTWALYLAAENASP